MLISAVPSLRDVPWSTSAWESSETRSDIAQSSPGDRQFSYWPTTPRPSLVGESASPSSSAAGSASGDPAVGPAFAFLRDLGGLFRKNLFCEDRASWDKRLHFLDWLISHDLAMGRKQKTKKPHETKMDARWYVTVHDSVKKDVGMCPVSRSCLKEKCECQRWRKKIS